MREFKGSFSFYIMMPVLAQLLLFYLCFNVTMEMFFYSLTYAGSLLVSILFVSLFLRKRINFPLLYDNLYRSIDGFDKSILKLFGLIVIMLFPADVYTNGFKLLNPATYAEFYGAGRFIRHITSLCWMLIPIAYAIRRDNRFLANLFILCAFALPVMMIDRNRLLMSFFCYFFILYARYRSVSVRADYKEFRAVKRGLRTLFILLPVFFVMIGIYRSGSSFSVESSGDAIVYGKFPLTNFFELMPSSIKQILLYITTPILNFTHIASVGFLNSDFLLSQFSPFSRDEFSAYSYAPVLIARYNVGTEFYPFLLFAGLPLVFIAMFFVVLIYGTVFEWFCRSYSMCAWLVFLKFTYTMLFLGFAPQFYILLNIMSIVLIFLLFFTSSFLKLALVGRRSSTVMREPYDGK